MLSYLIYCYDQDGLVRSGAYARCLNPNEALAAAWQEMLPDDTRGEVWQRHRRLFLIVSGAAKSASIAPRRPEAR
jgi:hypothetical protein